MYESEVWSVSYSENPEENFRKENRTINFNEDNKSKIEELIKKGTDNCSSIEFLINIWIIKMYIINFFCLNIESI